MTETNKNTIFVLHFQKWKSDPARLADFSLYSSQCRQALLNGFSNERSSQAKDQGLA